jgi:hypothetical protein
MPSVLPGLPAANEYAPAFERYILRAVQFPNPVEALATQSADFVALLRSLDPQKRLYRYAPGKWSIQQMLGHVIDAERVFAYRALTAARKDSNKLPPFEEDDWVAAAHIEAYDWEELVEEFAQVRAATVHFFQHLSPDAWTRTVTANSAPASVRALAYITLGHVAHHTSILRERYL